MPFRRVLELNPLTHAVEDVRRVLMWGRYPDWRWWAAAMAASAVVAVLGYAFFMKSKRAFADVL
jgi:lipopolysaccharide transport system permease protein